MSAPKPRTPSTQSVSALPTWLLISLLCLVGAIIIGVFAMTWFNLSAPRSTLKTLLGRRRPFTLRAPGGATPDQLVAALSAQQAGDGDDGAASEAMKLVAKVAESTSKASRVNKRTTRTTLAITGFSFLGLLLVGVYGLSGTGVRDLRTGVTSSIITLAASIGGFYFGSSSSGSKAAKDGVKQETDKPDTKAATARRTTPVTRAKPAEKG